MIYAMKRVTCLVEQVRPTTQIIGTAAALLPSRLISTPARPPLPFDTVLIANRGEIACRIARGCKDLGLKTVGIYAKEDAESLHVRSVDQAIQVFSDKPGPIAPYLDVENIVAAAKKAGAGAVHPGYGFLSESADFSGMCAQSNIRFIGPKAETIALLGDKVRAKELAENSGVPILRGSGFLDSAEDASAFLKQHNIGFPIIFKAAFGGGGRGMRTVLNEAELADNFNRCTSEAKTAFGNGAVFLEEFLQEMRHIEIQIIADGQGGVKHLFERDCSVQIRNQKVVEIAPARMHPGLRTRITDCAVELARNCQYRGVGTVEFMLVGDINDPDARFVFMEVNPRIQVEHTITEEVTGVDIVKAQLAIAGGATLEQLHLPGGEGHAASTLRGFSIQARISLAPGGGKVVERYREPSGDGVRVDGALYEGIAPSVHYDPLVGKLICTAYGEGDAAFEAARAKTLQALEDYEITGVNTNKPLIRGILQHEELINNDVLVSFMARHGAALAKAGAQPSTAVTKKKERGPGRKMELAVNSPLEGTIMRVPATVGMEVKEGDILAVLSAMKLETEVLAPADGVVKSVSVVENDTVGSDQEMVVLDAIVFEEEEEIASTASSGERRRAGSAASASNPAAIWFGPDVGVSQCTGPSTTTLKLPKARKNEVFDKRVAHHAELRKVLEERQVC